MKYSALFAPAALLFAGIHAASWEKDPELLSFLGDGCDFPVVDGLNALQIVLSSYPDTPVVLRNLTNGWLAHSMWTKDSLMERFGDRIIRTGSASSIVYSAGHAEVGVTLRSILTNLTDSKFVFDTTVLSVIPELNDHFTVPTMFADWDTPEGEAAHSLWHMLSLGPSRAGLPFHNHGKTWIAVVHGSKYWFIYPPGTGPPRSVDLLFSPTHSTLDWLQGSYPKILQQTQAKAPTGGAEGRYAGYRPLECLQRAGDVMFLPSMWTHATLNIGDTIAIGGQQYLEEQERLRIALDSFRGSESSYESLKDLALATYYHATRVQREAEESLQISEDGIVHLRDLQQLQALGQASMDPVALLLYQQGESEEVLRNFAALCLDLSAQGIAMDTAVLAWETDRVSPSSIGLRLADESTLSLPLMVLFPGLSSVVYAEHMDAPQGEEVFRDPAAAYTWDASKGTLLPLQEGSEGIACWIETEGLVQGSVGADSSSVFTQLQAARAVALLRKALALRPLHPEPLHFLSEIASQVQGEGVWEDLQEALIRAEDAYDRSALLLQIPRVTFASLYHKLADAYEKAGALATALRLLDKALREQGSFLPALRDSISLHLQMGHREEAQRMLGQVSAAMQAAGMSEQVQQMEMQEILRLFEEEEDEDDAEGMCSWSWDSMNN